MPPRTARRGAVNALLLIAAIGTGCLVAWWCAAVPSVASPGGARARVPPGTQLWASRFKSLTDNAIAVGGGSRVFATGSATIAYDAVTGAVLWSHQPADGVAVAVSPDGSTVFVTGPKSTHRHSSPFYYTVAYNAATGAQRWASSYALPGDDRADPQSVAVSPDGGAVFVTGFSRGDTSGFDYTTVGYDAATGAQLWVRRYNGPGNGDDLASSVTVSPSGGTVYVTGTSSGGAATGSDYATVAYDAATGARRWVSRYTGPGSHFDGAAAVRVSPGGRTVFVTGQASTSASSSAYATVAYSAATGALRWARRYGGSGHGLSAASGIAISPDGGVVYVTGSSPDRAGHLDFATIAYRAATGARRWASRYRAPGCDSGASAVAVGPGGRKVFVTGTAQCAGRFAFATVAYRAATGARQWVRHYDLGANFVSGLAVSQATDTVFVTGNSVSRTHVNNFATVAYRG